MRERRASALAFFIFLFCCSGALVLMPIMHSAKPMIFHSAKFPCLAHVRSDTGRRHHTWPGCTAQWPTWRNEEGSSHPSEGNTDQRSVSQTSMLIAVQSRAQMKNAFWITFVVKVCPYLTISAKKLQKRKSISLYEMRSGFLPVKQKNIFSQWYHDIHVLMFNF